jgi:hypothetical protein
MRDVCGWWRSAEELWDSCSTLRQSIAFATAGPPLNAGRESTSLISCCSNCLAPPDDTRRHGLFAVLLKRLGPRGILRTDPMAAHHNPIDDFDIPFEYGPVGVTARNAEKHTVEEPR